MVKNAEYRKEINELREALKELKNNQLLLNQNLTFLATDLHQKISHNAYVIGLYAQVLEDMGVADIDRKTMEFKLRSKEDIQSIADKTFLKDHPKNTNQKGKKNAVKRN